MGERPHGEACREENRGGDESEHNPGIGGHENEFEESFEHGQKPEGMMKKGIHCPICGWRAKRLIYVCHLDGATKRVRECSNANCMQRIATIERLDSSAKPKRRPRKDA